MINIPDISSSNILPFEVDGKWYEVFHGRVRQVFYGGVIWRNVEYFWMDNKKLVNKINQLKLLK